MGSRPLRSLGTGPKTRPQLRLYGLRRPNRHHRSQASLPETPDELFEVARQLDVPEGEFLLGPAAAETRLKELLVRSRLADCAILPFATHGALSGQLKAR